MTVKCQHKLPLIEFDRLQNATASMCVSERDMHWVKWFPKCRYIYLMVAGIKCKSATWYKTEIVWMGESVRVSLVALDIREFTTWHIWLTWCRKVTEKPMLQNRPTDNKRWRRRVTSTTHETRVKVISLQFNFTRTSHHHRRPIFMQTDYPIS